MQCSKCGSPGTGKFCVKCGGGLVEVAPPPPVAMPTPVAPPPMTAAAMTAGINAATMTAASIAEANARAAEAPEITRGAGARTAAAAYLKLQPSEQAVLAAASRVFAALVSTNQVTEANEPDMVNRAVRAAIRLAMVTEKMVQSDDEEW